jgi:pentatricopeptide repeat protein
VITYSASISTCKKGKHPERALDFFGEMQQKGLEPNVITYSTSISTCKKAKHPEKALELPVEM